MLIFSILLGILFLVTFWMGFRRWLRLKHLNRHRIFNTLVAIMIIFTLLAVAKSFGFIAEEVIARFTEFLYILFSGFFFGYGLKMVQIRKKLRDIIYVHRSFWTDAAPNLLCVLLIAFGLYQTGIISWGPFTKIGITSGISLVGFGFFGLTVRVVPEFREKGILILDHNVHWEKVAAYRWKLENVLEIDYYTEQGKLTEFSTYIPDEDELTIEKLMGKKLAEYEEERKKQMEKLSEPS